MGDFMKTATYKDFLLVLASILFFQSFNSVYSMDATKLAVATVGTVALAAYATDAWQYPALKVAAWHLDINKKKSQNIAHKEYQSFDDEQLVKTYKNIGTYNDLCNEVKCDKGTLANIQWVTNLYYESLWGTKKAGDFSKEIADFSDKNGKILDVVTNRLKFFEERKPLVELANLVDTEAVVLRQNTEKRMSKVYPLAQLYTETENRKKIYEDKIAAVNAFQKKTECSREYAKKGLENKNILQGILPTLSILDVSKTKMK